MRAGPESCAAEPSARGIASPAADPPPRLASRRKAPAVARKATDVPNAQRTTPFTLWFLFLPVPRRDCRRPTRGYLPERRIPWGRRECHGRPGPRNLRAGTRRGREG